MMVFDGGHLGQPDINAIALPKNELRGFAFCTLEEMAERVVPRMARRLVACVAARQAGTAAYLENGFPVIGKSVL